MAPRDPELLVAAASAVGADVLMPLLEEPTPFTGGRAPLELRDPYYQPHRQRHAPPPEWLPEDEDETKRFQQEMELTQLQQEVEATKWLILEVRREAEEATATAAAATARAAAHAQQAVEAVKQEESRHALIGEEAARASSLAAETAKLAAAHALVDAREPEHRMVVHAAIVLKAEQEKKLARQ